MARAVRRTKESPEEGSINRIQWDLTKSVTWISAHDPGPVSLTNINAQESALNMDASRLALTRLWRFAFGKRVSIPMNF